MDKDFEQKVKRKKLRTIAIAVILIGLGIFMLLDMNVEKADYTKDLDKTIENAQEEFKSAKEKGHGNGEGEYAEYTLITFNNQIKEAKSVASSEDSVYNDKKMAYEELKDLTKVFKKDVNKDVLKAEDIKAAIDDKTKFEKEIEIKKDTKVKYTFDGNKMKEPLDINLMARSKGPYEGEVNRFFRETGIVGTSISFYQEGSFGGNVKVEVPAYSEGKEKAAYVYKYDAMNGIMTFTGKASVNNKNVSFYVNEGGVYLITMAKLHKDAGTKDLIIEDVIQANRAPVEVDPDGEKIKVSIEIRCDVLSEDMSKLEKKELKEYIPEDGAILEKTEVTINKGQTVFDVLNKVCRDNEIQLETSYTPTYASYYVEGINYLYEFDAGNLSGWTYQVNGKTPNYGASSYKLSEGDEISWQYTCDLGKDVGSYVGE